MIVAISTSSPVVSVALFGADGNLLTSNSREAPRAAGSAGLDMLRELLAQEGRSVSDASLFVADSGPGSFVGVRVGVTIAKVLALEVGVQVAGVSAFDLIDLTGTALTASKRGEYFMRVPGQEPIRHEGLPEGTYKGYGRDIESPVYPDMTRLGPLLGSLKRVPPEDLVPFYLAQPAISTPKKPYRAPGGQGA